MRDSNYIPLLGGPRERNIEIVSVTPPGDSVSVEIVGDIIRIEAGETLKDLPFNVPFPVPLLVTYIDGDGNTVQTGLNILAVNTPEGVALTLPGGATVMDTALLSPLPLGDMAGDPFTIGGQLDAPIFFNEDILVQIFNAQNPQYIEAVIETQAAVISATTAKIAADAALADASSSLSLVNDAFKAREEATALQTFADAQRKSFDDTVNAFSAALQDVAVAQAAVALAQQAAAEATAIVGATAQQVDLFKTVIVPQAVSEFVIAINNLAILLAQLGLPAPASDHFDNPIYGAHIESFAAARDDAEQAVQEAQLTLDNLQQDLDAALTAQIDAVSAQAQATVALAAAQEALAEFEGIDFAQFEATVEALEVQATLADNAADLIEGAAAGALGVEVPVTEETIAPYSADFSNATLAQTQASIALVQAQAAFETAAAQYAAQLDTLPDVEFDVAIAALGLQFGINAGLEFHFTPATETEDREIQLALAYDFTLEFEVDGAGVIRDVFLGIDEEFEIGIDQTVARSGHVAIGGGDRADRPPRDIERQDFERQDFERQDFERQDFVEQDLARLSAWTDTFDFA